MSEVPHWQAWHDEYADPSSSLSRRLIVVRSLLAGLLEEGEEPVRLLNLCAGDGRDTIPVLAQSGRHVDACLVELDAGLANGARRAAAEAGVDLEVRTGDAGEVATFEDRLPVDLLMLCGIFGNISDADVVRTVAAARLMVATGGAVIWTRGHRVPDETTDRGADPADWVRGRFEAVGFVEIAFVRPQDATFRVGVDHQTKMVDQELPQQLFSFVR
jgi:hypothetical protein